MEAIANQGGPPNREGHKHGRLARESALSLGGTVVAGALNLLLPVLVTRQLAVSEAGVYFQAVALLFVLLNVGALGADTGLLRSLPAALATGEHRAIPIYLRSALVVPTLCATTVAIGLVLTAPKLTQWFVNGSEQEPVMTSSLYVVAGFLPLAVAYVVGMAATRGLHSIRMLVLVDKLGKGVVQLAFVAAAVVSIGSAPATVAGWAAGYVFGFAIVAWWLIRFVRDRLPHDRGHGGPTNRELVREFWRFSLPRAVSRLCNTAMQRGDIFLVGALAGPADAAVYAAATRFVVLGTLLAQSLQQVMAPKVSDAIAVGDTESARVVFQLTTTWLTGLAWPVYLMAANFAPLLLDAFGPSYDRGWPAAVILCLVMLIATACGPVDTVLLMSGRSMLSLVNAAVSLAIMTCVDLLLIPVLGVTGAAIGWACGLAVNNLLALVQVHASLSMHPFSRGFLAVVGVTVLCFGVIPFILVTLFMATLPIFGLAAMISIVLSAIFLWRNLTLFGLDRMRALWGLRRI